MNKKRLHNTLPRFEKICAQYNQFVGIVKKELLSNSRVEAQRGYQWRILYWVKQIIYDKARSIIYNATEIKAAEALYKNVKKTALLVKSTI